MDETDPPTKETCSWIWEGWSARLSIGIMNYRPVFHKKNHDQILNLTVVNVVVNVCTSSEKTKKESVLTEGHSCQEKKEKQTTNIYHNHRK